MSLPTQTISVNLGQGMDTKTDEKQVVPGKFRMLENAVFTAPKRVNKRNGTTELTTDSNFGTLSQFKLSKSYQNELVTLSSNEQIYSRNQSGDSWLSKGEYIPVEVRTQLVSALTYPERMQSSAIAGNYLLYAFQSRVYNQATSALQYYAGYIGAIDLQTGSRVTELSSFFNSTHLFGSTKACRMGTSTPGFFGLNSSNELGFTSFTIGINGAQSFISTTIATDVAGYTQTYDAATRRILRYDCASTSTGAVVAYSKAPPTRSTG